MTIEPVEILLVEDILRSCDLHANCYIHKPVDFQSFISVIQSIDSFWLSVVKLPNGAQPAGTTA